MTSRCPAKCHQLRADLTQGVGSGGTLFLGEIGQFGPDYR
jgi:hypothetical protein